MQYRCSRCHTLIEGDEVHRCPNCGAEAGLEPIKGIPGPMRMFGLLLATVVVAAITGGLWSRIAGV